MLLLTEPCPVLLRGVWELLHQRRLRGKLLTLSSGLVGQLEAPLTCLCFFILSVVFTSMARQTPTCMLPNIEIYMPPMSFS